MNKHIFIDNLTANTGSLIPAIKPEGTFDIRATAGSDGYPDPAFRIEKWFGDDYPSFEGFEKSLIILEFGSAIRRKEVQ